MYKSPVEVIETVWKSAIEERDEKVFAKIQSQFEVRLDKDELIRALQHDRDQYEKGYADGRADAAPQWIPVTERLPEVHTEKYEEWDGTMVQYEVSEYQWIITRTGEQTKAVYETGVVFQGWVSEIGNTVRGVTHWMPLPEPPKEDLL